MMAVFHHFNVIQILGDASAFNQMVLVLATGYSEKIEYQETLALKVARPAYVYTSIELHFNTLSSHLIILYSYNYLKY